MVQITIRNVPEEVRDELAARAARNRQSMQEYLLSELEQLASQPTIDEWLHQVRERVEASGTHIPRSAILEARYADRT
jgi:cation transport regulator ChaC